MESEQSRLIEETNHLRAQIDNAFLAILEEDNKLQLATSQITADDDNMNDSSSYERNINDVNDSIDERNSKMKSSDDIIDEDVDEIVGRSNTKRIRYMN